MDGVDCIFIGAKKMNFDQAFDRLIGHEGGYSNRNPADDPGGETNWGISKRSYPHLDIKSLTRDQAAVIYFKDFWEPLQKTGAHPAVMWQAFDFAVNAGIQTSIRKIQTAIGVADDGHWGPVSGAKLASMDVNDVVMLFNAEQLDYRRKLSNWASNSSGWTARVANNLRYAAKDN